MMNCNNRTWRNEIIIAKLFLIQEWLKLKVSIIMALEPLRSPANHSGKEQPQILGTQCFPEQISHCLSSSSCNFLEAHLSLGILTNQPLSGTEHIQMPSCFRMESKLNLGLAPSSGRCDHLFYLKYVQ